MTHTIAIAGASGRMGQMLIDAVRAADDCRLGGALDIASSPALGLGRWRVCWPVHWRVDHF